MPQPPIAATDLDAILAATSPLWQEMRNQRLFLTGGTGFFGCWLVESFLHINGLLNLNARITVLSRNPEAFLVKLPNVRGNPALTLLEGDVRSFEFPADTYDFVIHAATEASAALNLNQPAEMRRTILEGTAHTLAFAGQCGARKLLFTSSGAVYGPQPADVTHIAEDQPPARTSDAYAEGKRGAEQLCLDAASAQLEIKIARCFAFFGPHLPLDTHFAAGNFLADALAGRPIKIASDGTSLRSYLYAADLTIWLWTMLFSAPSKRPYNVGSEEAFSICELAENIASTTAPGLSVGVAQTADASRLPHRYVPSTARARTELKLDQTVSLAEGFRRTAAWHRLKLS